MVAIPFFLLLIGLELWLDHKRKTGFYRFNDAITSLQLGILSRVSGVLIGLIPFTFYVYFYQNWKLFDVSTSSYLAWLLAFIAYDLVYYWVHRLSHTINIMWGSHVVHHSSEEYNLTTALRQTSTPAVFAWVISAPLAFIGVPPEMLVTCASLNLVYQFWVHTRHIKKMPAWYEAVFVTPSHHRVHHALNRDYIDKNYAGVLILWDKLFGSFQQEKEDTPVVFGISSQLASWNPLKANYRAYVNLWKDFKVTKGVKNKLKVWLSPPSWRSLEAKEVEPRRYCTSKNLVKYNTIMTGGQRVYVLFQHISTIVLTLIWLLKLPALSIYLLLLTCGFAIFSLVSISNLQENKAYAVTLETLRLGTFCGIIWFLIPAQEIALTIGTLYVGVSFLLLHSKYRPSVSEVVNQN